MTDDVHCCLTSDDDWSSQDEYALFICSGCGAPWENVEPDSASRVDGIQGRL